MEWRDVLTAVGIAIELAGAVYYFWAIMKDKTRPHPASWAGWTAIGAVGAWSARAGGAGLSFYVAASFVFVTFVIFLASMMPGKRYVDEEEGHSTDLPVLALGIILLILRAMSIGSPWVGSTLAIAGDACFAWFTWRKVIKDPKSEIPEAWVAAFVAAVLGVIVLGHFSYSAAAFPVYIAAGNALITWPSVKYKYFNSRCSKRRRRA